MTEFMSGPAKVPDELYPYMDDQYHEVHTHWQDAYVHDVLPTPTALKAVDIGDEVVRIGQLDPVAEDDGSVVALAFPYNNGLGTSMDLRARFMHESIIPNSTVILLPNVPAGREATYTFSPDECRRLAEGSLAPLGEKYVRVLEKLGVSRISLTGYSQGARTVLEMAAVGSPSIEITHVNADEVPSQAGRDAKQLQKDFMKSGGFGLQRKSMAESGFGQLMKEIAGMQLAIDYARFGVASLGAVSKLVHKGMTGSVNETVQKALVEYDGLKLKFGTVEGSRLSDLEDIRVPRNRLDDILVQTYTGASANKHTTGDNYAAHALMVRAGLNR